MGWASRLGGIGAMIAGGVAAFIPGGQMAAGALLSGGAHLLAGGEQAGAATKAAEQQAASARDAQAINQQVYTQQRADFSPYMQVGAGSMNTLGSMVGLPPIVMPPSPGTAPPGPPGAVPRPGDSDTGPRGSVRRAPEMLDAQHSQAQARAATESAYGPRTGSTLGALGGGFVTLLSPDGRETKAVPRDQAEFYMARGARQVN